MSDEVKKFRKKPVVIEAMLFDGTHESASRIARWANAGDEKAGYEDPTVSYIVGGAIPEGMADDMVIQTLEGGMSASVGDWIIRGVKGEFYACKPDIFAMTYEPADAAIAALGGWRTKDSAPKNTPLLVYDARSKEYAVGWVYDFTRSTHWMPLPAPPSKEG